MPGTDRFPVGAPCWVDLWTSDVEGSRAFYAQLFGWEAMEPSEEFGGYFMFHRNGQPIAGGMGDMGPQMPANDTWKIYLSTDDIAGEAAALEASGAEVVAPPMAVADLGQNMVFVDPTGAQLGAWQPETFPGFATVDEHGAPVGSNCSPVTSPAPSSSTVPSSTGRQRSKGTRTSSGTRHCATRIPTTSGLG